MCFSKALSPFLTMPKATRVMSSMYTRVTVKLDALFSVTSFVAQILNLWVP